MTKLDKPISRETSYHYRAKPVIATMTPAGITLRLKGTQQTISAGWESLFRMIMRHNMTGRHE